MWMNRMPAGYESLTEWNIPATDIALRMSNGDISMISVRYPQERDNAKRGYFLTGTAMNKGRNPEQPIRGVELAPDAVEGLVIEIGSPLTVRNPDRALVSEGEITEITSYDRTRPVRSGSVGVSPSSIADDFLREAGGLPFVEQ
jgi:hypothetical protein